MANSTKRSHQLRRKLEKGSFNILRKDVVRALQKKGVSPRGYKLLIDIFEQFNGYNNGDLSTPFSIFKNKGWNSKTTLSKAKKELLDRGFIELTRQGMRHPPICDLFAVTWEPIDECDGKLDVTATRVASSLWRIYP